MAVHDLTRGQSITRQQVALGVDQHCQTQSSAKHVTAHGHSWQQSNEAPKTIQPCKTTPQHNQHPQGTTTTTTTRTY
jgi:hypothetical protein